MRSSPAANAIRGAAGAALVLLLAACGGTPAPEPNPLGPPPPDEASAAAVWSYLQESEYQRYWEPEAYSDPAIHRSRPPHGPLIRVYVNKPAHRARPLGRSRLPAGSVVVLESYNSEPHLHAIDVMAKIEGHREGTHDWAFFRFGPSGGVEVTDAEARRQDRKEDRGCIHCHGRTAAETDYLYQPRLAD